MTNFWNSRIKNIRPYTPGEQPKDRKFIKLNTNENPYPPSDEVIKAIQKASNGDLRLYPDPLCSGFREAVSERYRVRPQQVFAGNGSDEILGFAFGAFFESASGSANETPILFPDITYSFYPVYANLWNIPYRAIPLCEDFSINSADYKIPCGGVIFPNPNAPTGIPVPLGEILPLAEFLEGHGKILIVDEAYAAFGAESAVSHITDHPNMLTMHTLSKAASLAGLRCGFAIGDEALIEGLCRIRDSFNSYTMDRLALAGATAAISSISYYNAINQKVIATRDRTARELRLLKFNVLPSSANFLFIKAPGIKGSAFFSALREKGILVRHFNSERIADFVRVSIGCDNDMDIFLSACRGIVGME